jgi:hypothetical protein
MMRATHVDVVQTTQDTSSQFTSERVPHSVLDLLLLAQLVLRGYADPLLSVDRLSGRHVSGDEQVLLALGNVDTGVLVWLQGDGAGSSATESWLAASSTTSTAWCSSASGGSSTA